MGVREDVARLVKDATASMKGDLKGAVTKLEAAWNLARGEQDPEEAATVAEELARAWSRRKSSARSLYYAYKATKLAPARKTAWTTLAKTCELVASRIPENKHQRARALYRAAASAFEKAASMTKDPEDRRWLQELARDAKKQGRPPKDQPTSS